MERPGSRSHKGPYDRKEGRKSFLSKMKDTIKDYMISPSWMSKSDSSTQEKSESKANTATPSTSGGYMGAGYAGTRSFQTPSMGLPNGQAGSVEYSGREQGNVDIPFQTPNLTPPISEFTSSLLPLNRLTEKSDSVLANEDTMSQRSDVSKSTSGCSSMVPQLDGGRRDSGVEKRKAPDQETQESSPRSPGPQPTAKRQRLNVSLNSGNRTWTQRFNESVLGSQQPQSNLKRPAFDPSLFGSPLNDTSVLGTSFHESSFYSGKTVYGGRSSFRSLQKNKVDLNQSLPSRLTFPVKSFVKARPKAYPIREAVTSSTAKRILDVLDRMPTPLADAKKIPVIVPRNWTQSPSFFSRDTMSSSSVEPPTRRQPIAALADISKNRQTSSGQRSQDNSMMSPVASTSSSFTAVGLQREDKSTPVSASGKMRHEKSYQRNRGAVKPALDHDDTVILAPPLKTDFTLPVASIPQFNFATPTSQQTSQKSDTTSKPTALDFTFSSPIVESTKPASPQNVGGFQFSSPISLDKKQEPSKNAVINELKAIPAFTNFSTPSNMQMTFSTAPKPKAKANGPTEEPSNSSFKPANQLKQGSVMDILGGGSSSSAAKSGTKNTMPLSTMFKQKGWTCDICLIQNKEDVTKCAACSSPKPGVTKQNGAALLSSQGSSSAVPLSALFKQSGWTCDSCLVSNKAETEKCVACTATKPGAKKMTGQPNKPNLLSQNSVLPGNWVCKTCLIQNKAEDKVCGACKSTKQTSITKDLPKKDDLMTKFKPPPGQWDCEVCLIQNKADANSCLACQSPKPLKSFKPPPGDWECDTCLVNNKAKDVKCIACGYTRPGPPRTQAVPNCAKTFSMSQPSGFSFTSAPNSDTSKDSSSNSGFKFGTASSASGFKFGATSSENSSKTSDSGFKLGNSSETVPASSGFKFGSVNSSESKKSDNSISTKFGTAKTSEEKKSTNSDNSDKKVEEKKTSGMVCFQFGSKPTNDSTALPSGGFGALSSSSAPTSGLQFGVSATKSSTPLGGFQLGSMTPASTVTSAISSSVTSISVSSNSTVVSTSDQVKTSLFASSVGGFTLPTSGSLLNNSSQQPTTQGVGGFNFAPSSTKDTNSTTTTTGSVTAFVFEGSKPSEVTPKPEAQKTGFGGLNTEKPVTAASTPPFGSFNFAQKKDEVAAPANNITSKRVHEEDTGETAAKKGNFNFGSNTSSSAPFQFGGANNTSQSSSPYVFGQQNSTTQAGGFQFNMNKPNDASGSLFGKSSTQTTSAAPMFGNLAGQKSEQTSNTPLATNTGMFNNFGGTAKQAPAPASGPSFNFGGANTNSSTFGAGSGNAFGGNVPSTTPAFGATPPMFGSTNTGTLTTSTPAFGGKLETCLKISSASLSDTSSDFPISTRSSHVSHMTCTAYNEISCSSPLNLLANTSTVDSSCEIIQLQEMSTFSGRKFTINSKDIDTQTEKYINLDKGLQAEFKTVILKDQGMQTERKRDFDTSSMSLPEIGFGHLSKFKESSVDSNNNIDLLPLRNHCWTNVLTYTRSLLVVADPIYCTAKGKFDLQTVSATQIRCMSFVNVKTVNKVNTSAQSVSRYTSSFNDLINSKHLNTSNVPNADCRSKTVLPTGIGQNFPAITKPFSGVKGEVAKPTNVQNIIMKPSENRLKLLSTSCSRLNTNVVTSVLSVTSQIKSVLPTLSNCTTCITYRKQEDSLMDTEISPNNKPLLEMQSVTNQPGPSKLILFGPGSNKLRNDFGKCRSVSAANMDTEIRQNYKPVSEMQSITNQPGPSKLILFGPGSNKLRNDFGTCRSVSAVNMDTESRQNYKPLSQMQSVTNQPGPSKLVLFGPGSNKLRNDLGTCRSFSVANIFNKSTVDCPFAKHTNVSDVKRMDCREGFFTDIHKSNQTESLKNVCFNFAPPVNVFNSKNNPKPEKALENIGSSRSILKQKTKEMVSAFNCTSMMDSENNICNTQDFIGITDITTKKNMACSSAFSIFGGAKSFCNLTHNQDSSTSTHNPQSMSTSYGSQNFSKDSFFVNVKKDKTYFTLGKMDACDSDEPIDKDHKDRKSSDRHYRYKQHKMSDFHGIKSRDSVGSFNLQSNMFCGSSRKTTSIAIVPPVESANIFRFPVNLDKTACNQGTSQVMCSSSKSITPCSNVSARSCGYVTNTDVNTDEKSSCSTSRVFVFGSSSGKSKDDKQSSTLPLFDGTCNKESFSNKQPLSSGVCFFGGSSSSNKTTESPTPSLFKFVGSTNRNSTKIDQPSSSGVYVFGAQDNKPDVSSEVSSTSVKRRESTSSCVASTTSNSNTSVSSNDSTTSSDSDTSTSSSSSSNSSSSSTSTSDEDQESSRMECSSNDIEGLRDCLPSDNTDSEQRNRSQNSCRSDSVDTELYREKCISSSLSAPLSLGGGVFQFGSNKTSVAPQPAQTTNTSFQFGAKPPENNQPAPTNTGFNFNAAAQAGLGGSANFNFSPANAPGTVAFSASSAPGTGERKYKKAVRKLKR